MVYNPVKAFKGKNAPRKRKNTVKTIYRNKNKIAYGANMAYQLYKTAQLASMINAEKKRYVMAAGSNALGQTSLATGAGYYALDITPTPQQGTTSITRTGNSIKLCSSFYQFQFSQLAQCTSPVKVRIIIFKAKGQVYSNVATAISNLLSLNPFVLNGGSPAIVDYNSSYNPDFYGQFEIIKEKKLTVKPDQFSGQNTITDIKFGLKYNRGKGHHIRYTVDGNAIPSEGQIMMVMLCDNGNATTTASTLSNALNTGASTGLNMNQNIIHYFYDN